ncbi:MAG: methyltransferase, partial [Candidatus Eremiobacterota bacterium]
SLHRLRLDAVLEALKASGASSVLDLGCGEGRLLSLLLREKRMTRVVGLDVSVLALERAARRLKLERLSERRRKQIELMHGSLVYRDARLEGFDAAAAVEVVEHLDPHRLEAFERCLFGSARPGRVVVTTPNAEYNALWPSLPAGRFRHRDHRFEWTRAEFQAWAEGVATRFGYRVGLHPIGPEDPERGAPTQMAVFDAD